MEGEGKFVALFPLNDGSDSIESTYPYNELWVLLIEKTIKAGHMLTPSEAQADPKFVSPNSYAIAFGGRFSDWAKEAWRTITMEKEEAMGKKWSKAQIIESIKKFCEENGKLPTSLDFNNDSTLPSYYTVYKIIGKKDDWVKLLDGDEGHPFGTVEANAFEVSQEIIEAPSEDNSEVPQETTDAPSEDNSEISQETTMVLEDELEAEPPQTEDLEIETSPVSQNVDVKIVDLPNQTTSGEGDTIIELKISLPGREAPINLRLSF